MASKSLVFIIFIAFYAAEIQVIDACQTAPPPGREPGLARPEVKAVDFPDQLLACLKSKGLSDRSAIDGIDKADLQCIVKYAWTQDDSSAKQFVETKSDYKTVYGYSVSLIF